ncbi:MAG: aminomethyl-transferring glycine dehydrogenase subunit GcvPA, partial [Oscillospiraceae bacterium]
RTKALISAAVHPDTLETVETYCMGSGTELIVIPAKDGITDMTELAIELDENVSCFYMQQPNFYGMLENATELAEMTHAAGAKFIMGVNPISLGVLKTPADYGADIAVGDGQPLGMPLSFGGPYLGFMAAKSAIARKLPGRIVGETTDVDGKRAFVLTLQAREQHIRREKATSNICSNQALCALTASVYMAAMGASGIYEAASQSMSKAGYMASKLGKIGYTLKFEGSFFHEFVTTSPQPIEKVMSSLEKEGILGGYPLSGELEGCILWCCTEQNTKEEIDRAVEILKEVQ